MLKIYAPQNYQRSFFDSLLSQALADNKLLSRVDEVLNDMPDLLDPFAKRYKEDRDKRNVNTKFGKSTICMESYVRLILLKMLHKNCAYRDVEERTKTDYAWKSFAKLRLTDDVPDYTTIAKWDIFFKEDTVKELHKNIIKYLTAKKIIKGRKMRSDTTAAEANAHFPTDNSLIADAVRIITRTIKKIKKIIKIKTVFRSRNKIVKKKLYALGNSLKKRTGHAKSAIKKTSKEMINITANIIGQAEQIAQETAKNIKNTSGKAAKELKQLLQSQIDIAKQLLNQSMLVFNGEKPADRLVSFFQPWARPIVKGKLGIKCEFGKKLEINEVEHGIISDWEIHQGNPSDINLLLPAIKRHKKLFHHYPKDVATDRGFYSADNEHKLKKKKGIKNVSLPKRGYKTKRRLRTEHSNWFQELQNWRAGGEAKMSWLKRTFGIDRSKAKTEIGFDQAIAWGIIGCNFKVIANLA